MTGAIGGVGGVGGAGALGAVGGVASATAPQAAAPSAAPSETVSISAQGRSLLASEAPQPGANFSVSADKGGHQYIGGYDACGCPQSFTQRLDKLEDLAALALLAILTEDDKDKQGGGSALVSALAAGQAVAAYRAIQSM